MTTSSSASTTCPRRRPAPRPMRFQDLSAVIDVLDIAYERESARSCARRTIASPRSPSTSGRNPERYPDFECSRACPTRTSTRTRSPRTACSAPSVASCPRTGSSTRHAWRAVAGEEGHRRDHHPAHRRRDEDVRRARDAGRLPAERRRRHAARARLRRGLQDLPRPRPLEVRRRTRLHHHERADAGAEAGKARRRNDRSSARTSTRSASGCRAGPTAYDDDAEVQRRARSSRCRCSHRARSQPARRSSGCVPSPTCESIVFGASSRGNIENTKALVDECWAGP